MRFSSEIKVGLITLIAVLLFIWISIALQKWTFKEKGYEIEVIFNKVAGLSEQSSVFLSGVEVGKVKRVYLRPDTRVSVKIRLKPNLKIKDNSLFIINTESLLALEKYIEIIPQPGKANYLKPGAKVKGQDPLETRELVYGLKKTFDEVRGVTKVFHSLAEDEELIGDIRDTIKNINLASKKMAQLAEGITQITGTNQEEIRVIFDNLKQVSQNIKYASEKVANLVGDKTTNQKIKQIVHSLKESSQEIEKMTKRLEEEFLTQDTTKNLKNVVKGTDEIVQKVNSTLEKIENTIVEPEVEFGYRPKLNLYQGNLNLKFSPPKSKTFYTLGVNDLENKRSLNLQVGKNLSPTEVQLGIKEGKLGVGIKYQNKSALLKGELINPNDLRFNWQAGWEIIPQFYFLWGKYEDADGRKDDWIGIEGKR